jgi:hypothetical protein
MFRLGRVVLTWGWLKSSSTSWRLASRSCQVWQSAERRSGRAALSALVARLRGFLAACRCRQPAGRCSRHLEIAGAPAGAGGLCLHGISVSGGSVICFACGSVHKNVFGLCGDGIPCEKRRQSFQPRGVSSGRATGAGRGDPLPRAWIDAEGRIGACEPGSIRGVQLGLRGREWASGWPDGGSILRVDRYGNSSGVRSVPYGRPDQCWVAVRRLGGGGRRAQR